MMPSWLNASTMILLFFFKNNVILNLIEQIGPNVSISANARIGAGARLISCIILDGVEIKVCALRIENKLMSKDN